MIMKTRLSHFYFLCLAATLTLLAAPLTCFAASEPVISYNVHVLKNAGSGQCNGSWRGRTSPDVTTHDSGLGQSNTVGAAVSSCTGCKVDPASNDCVCHACYSYSN